MFKVAIDGNIGAGKTTLIKNLKYMYDNRKGSDYVGIHKEDINRNILDRFIEAKNKGDEKKQTRFELLSQLYFLLNTIIRETLSYEADNEVAIYDRGLAAHIHIFSKLNLKPINYFLYSGFQELTRKVLEFDRYDLQIILTVDFDENWKRICKRNRGNEVYMDKQYIKDLEEEHRSDYYHDICKEMYTKEILYIDVTEMNEKQVAEYVYKIIEDYKKEKHGNV